MNFNRSLAAKGGKYMLSQSTRFAFALALSAVVGLTQSASAAEICPLLSPVAANTTVTASPNSYYAGSGTATAGTKSVTIGAENGTGTAIGVNDEILLIEMQDSAIDTSDTGAYGSGSTTGRGVTSDNTSGEYEYAVVTAVNGATLTVAGNGAGGGLVNSYHTAGATATKGQQTFQVVRVPRYNNVTLDIAGSAVQPWNGSSGGVFAIDASGAVTVTGTLSVDAKGFRGGGRLVQAGATTAPDKPPYDFAVNGAAGYDADKGEGTVGTPEITFNGTTVVNSGADAMPGGSAAMGSPGIAGGGSTDADGTINDYNSGGGGGANGGDGGNGGNNWSADEQGTAAEASGTVDPANRIYAVGGLGGTAFAQRSVTHVVLGGVVQYSIVVSNAGPGRGDGTTITDPLPAGIVPKTGSCTAATGSACGAVTVTGQNVTSTIATLPVGGSVTFTIDAVAPTAGISNPYNNSATVTPPATNTDPNSPTSNVVATTVAESASSGLSKTVRNITTNEATGLTADTAKPGDTLEYTLTFANTTGISLNGFSVSDATPANTTYVSSVCGALPTGVTACTIAAPPVGGTGTVKFTYTGMLDAGQTGTFTLRVKVN